MLTLQIIATIFLGINIITTIIRFLCAFEVEELSNAIVYFTSVLLNILSKVFVIVVIWLK